MDDFNTECHICGGRDGDHYNDCIYDGISSGKSGLGGSALEKFIFAIFCIVGVMLGCFCPPLGAAIIVLGAKVTGA